MMSFRRIWTDLFALGLFGLSLFVAVALFSYDPADPPAQDAFPARTEASNLAGQTGAISAHYLLNWLGQGAWFLVVTLASVAILLLSRSDTNDLPVRIIGWTLSLAGICAVLKILLPQLGDTPAVGSGGYVGAFLVAILEMQLEPTGQKIFAATLVVGGILLSGDCLPLMITFWILKLPFRILHAMLSHKPHAEQTEEESTKKKKRKTKRREKHEQSLLEEFDKDPKPEPAVESSFDSVDDEEPKKKPRKPLKINPPVGTNIRRDNSHTREMSSGHGHTAQDFELPGLDLLEDPEEFPYEMLAKKAEIAAETLENCFAEFGMRVEVVEVDTGPVITQFEIKLEAGLRLSKVTALADDLAIALRVPSVRVVAPIPGKNTVGIEVPNENQVMVRLREIIESCTKEAKKHRIPLFLGKDVSGRPLAVDMAKMPHLLIAGRTGTGKSVCLNSLILSVLMTRSPDEVKMLMIDPKMVELSPYKRVPHLMHPVITDMKKAEAVLAWAVDKMEERYDLLARTGVRHLDSFNKLGREKVLDRLGIDEESEEADDIPEKMPYILIFADEMADMMMTSGKDVEGHIIRLAQKSRAVGIHLVLATQKPTVDVITGLIKSNLPARISFQVASRSDSRVVLDEMGADRLLGNGDMLYLAPGTSNLTRAQGAFVSDDEVNEIIDFYSEYEPEYSDELAQLSAAGSKSKGGIDAMRNRDELYEEAIEVVIREARGSTSLLQRALGIGYGRAARLIDYMAEDGIVGDYNGSQAREVLYSSEQWEAIKSGEELEEVAV